MERIINWKKYVDRSQQEEDEADDGGIVTESPIAELIRKTQSKQFPLFDPELPFELWTAITDFPVDDQVRYTVRDLPGVEIYNDISKYRFQVAIPPTFFASEVLVNIEKALGANQYDEIEPETPEWVEDADEYERLKKVVADSAKELNSSFKHWIVFFDNDTKVHILGGEAQTEFLAHLKRTVEGRIDTKGGYFFESSVFNT